MTVGGPPSSLAKLLSHPAVERFAKSRRDIRIFAPYHSPIFSKEETAEVVQGSLRFLEESVARARRQTGRAFIGCATGEFYAPDGPRQLLENVVYNILAQPIRWERVLRGCEAAIHAAGAAHPTAWRVRPIGQTKLAGLLATSLRSIDGLDVVFDDKYGRQSYEDAVATHFPIAIVGMAGRFPNADNPDAFWKDLKAGRDHHREVSIPIAKDALSHGIRYRWIASIPILTWSTQLMAAFSRSRGPLMPNFSISLRVKLFKQIRVKGLHLSLHMKLWKILDSSQIEHRRAV